MIESVGNREAFGDEETAFYPVGQGVMELAVRTGEMAEETGKGARPLKWLVPDLT